MNSSIDSVLLFSQVNTLSAWPNEILQIDLTPYTNGAPLSASSSFLRPDTLFVNAGSNTFSYTYLSVPATLTPGTVTTIASGGYPTIFGSALMWDVSRDDERGRLITSYNHPAPGYNNDQYAWQSNVFCSRVIPQIISGSTYAIELTSVLASPVIHNTATNALPYPGTPAATARGLTASSFDSVDADFPISRYSTLITTVSPIPAGTSMCYSSGGKTETVQFTATNTTGTTQTGWSSALSVHKIVSGSIIGIIDYDTILEQSTVDPWTRIIKDYGSFGTLQWFENDTLRTGVSAGGTVTINYDTAVMTVSFAAPWYFTPTIQSRITYDYIVASLNGYTLANTLTSINSKSASANHMATFYSASANDHVTLSSYNVPIYMYDIQTQISFDGVSSATPANNGYTISFSPTAVATNITANVIHISGGYVCNWSDDTLWNLASGGWHQINYQALTSSEVSYVTGSSPYDVSVGGWVAGTTYLTITAASSARRTTGTVSVTVSSVDGVEQTINVPWVINPDNWTMYPVLSSNDNDSAVAYIRVDGIDIVNTQQFAWSTSPNENVIIKSLSNGITIPQGTACYWTTGSEVSVSNLGVETTFLRVSSLSPFNSGSTSWSPSSWNNVTLELLADPNVFNNKLSTKTLPLSAMLKKRGFYYSMPSTVMLDWHVSHSNSVVSYGTTAADTKFNFNAPIAGSQFDVITAHFEVPTITANPTVYQIDLFASIQSSFLNLSSNPIPTYRIYVDDFPSINLLSISVSSVFNSATSHIGQFTSNRTHDIIVPVSATHLYLEDTSIIHNQQGRYPLLTRTWQLSSANGTYTFPATGSILDTTINPTGSSVSAITLSIDYYSDTWTMLHTHVLPVYIHFIDQIPVIHAAAFPSLTWQAASATPVSVTLTNYQLSSRGVSAYGNCHSELFTISASNNFDLYQFQFDNHFVVTPQTTAAYILTCPSFAATYTIGASGYNGALPIDMPSVYYDLTGSQHTLSNTTSSTSATTNPLWHNVNFIDYVAPTLAISSVDAPSFSLGSYARPIIDVTAHIDVLPMYVRLDSPFTITVDVKGTVPYSFSYDNNFVSGSNVTLVQFQTTDIGSDRYLSNESITPIVISVSGDWTQYINNEPYDWCTRTTQFDTVQLFISAYPSPIIEMFDSVQIACVDTPVTIINATSQTITAVAYDQFLIDNGDETTQTVDASASEISITYRNPGSYFIGVSGIQDGQMISQQTFGPIVVYDDCSGNLNEFDVNANRRLSDQLVLPGLCSKLSVQNEWVTRDTINSLITKTVDNLQYVIDNCTMYDPVIPFAYIGWFGAWNKSKTAKWNTNTSSKFQYNNSFASSLTDIRSIAWDSNYNVVHIVQGDVISMHSYDQHMTRISPSVQLPLHDLQACTLFGTKLCVIDKYTNGVYAYNTSPHSTTPYTLAQYFAQFGDINTRQGLNSPTDITNNGQLIFVVDSGNYVVKVYNESLAWVSQFTHEDFTDSVAPISIATSTDYIFVLANNKTIYKFNIDTYQFLAKWTVVDGQRIRTYNRQDGFITVIGSTQITKYTHIGTPVGSFSQPLGVVTDLCFNDKHTSIICSKDKLFAVLDVISKHTIRTSDVDYMMWSLQDLLIDSNEMVSALTYNSVLKKLWDNIAIIDRTIHSTFVQYCTPQTTDLNFAIVTNTTAQNINADSSQLLIGNNELVTSHVIERSFGVLCRYIEQLNQKISTQVRFDPCVDALCWTWQSLRGSAVPFSANCTNNPITWFELQSSMPTSFSKRWCDAIGCGCDTTTIPAHGLVLDDGITYLRIGGSVLILQ